MNIKEGDRVLIKDIDWYNANKDENGYILNVNGLSFTKSMSPMCGKICVVKKVVVEPERFTVNELPQFVFNLQMVEKVFDREIFEIVNTGVESLGWWSRSNSCKAVKGDNGSCTAQITENKVYNGQNCLKENDRASTFRNGNNVNFIVSITPPEYTNGINNGKRDSFIKLININKLLKV